MKYSFSGKNTKNNRFLEISFQEMRSFFDEASIYKCWEIAFGIDIKTRPTIRQWGRRLMCHHSSNS